MPHNAVAFEWLDNNFGIFVPTKSMLYVGWRPRSKMWFADVFAKKIGAERVGLLEVFEDNYNKFGHDGVEKFLGNVANVDKLFAPDEWDMVFWDHGPEHAGDENSLIEMTETIKGCTSCILYSCPWGNCPQAASGGNAYEKHGVSVTVEMLEGFGMSVVTFGKPNTGANGELVGWWKRDNE